MPYNVYEALYGDGDVKLWCVCQTREEAEAAVRHNPYRWIEVTGTDWYREVREATT